MNELECQEKSNYNEETDISLKAPFPYFGGKSRIASEIWQYLGDVKHYVEPFCGSCAVLFARPDYDPSRHIETVNDADGHIVNVWRSLKYHPDETAEYADEPVHHIELAVRKRILNQQYPELKEKLLADENFHDPKIAAYYIWASSCWIGSGLTHSNAIPHLSGRGSGIHSIGQRPDICNNDYSFQGIKKWFQRIMCRLRRVRVVNGDWTQVCGGNWQNKVGLCGIFFDPPYGHGIGKRSKNLYLHDSLTISGQVRAWCLNRGKLKTYRIVLAGYEGEHNELEDHGWIKHAWKATGGYANTARKSDSVANSKENAKLERLWISPYCVKQNEEKVNQLELNLEL